MYEYLWKSSQQAATKFCPDIKIDLTPLPPGQNGRHFADNIFICIFVNDRFCILIKISLKFVPKSSIDINPALI